ncbi:MAG: sigma-70 family RNA polymerase sigma factor [Clostridiales bacterium]|nr:sigma-70 family RNA polymerase sigma factor [Clostridiales bacterium]
MEKELCDKLICEYNKKLYGFAISKTNSIERAEELAARITLEVYSSLLKRENIINVKAYIYRIAQNVYAHFTDEYKNSQYCDIDDFELADPDDFTEKIAQSEEYARLRCEIAYLSKLRREILVRHYYNNMKLSDIAKSLYIPLGTVKWHLSGAKSSLKEGMNIMRNIGKLGLDPIEMCSLGHDGNPGAKGDTSDFLAKRLTQNIAYAAYQNPLTINEIADELGVSPIFVADEVETLEEYGFMDRIGDKYLTNIFIQDTISEIEEGIQKLNVEYSAKVADMYIPQLIESLNAFDRSKVYIPNNDNNLWLWAGIMFALSNKLNFCMQNDSLDKFRVKRKDGGDYIAHAYIKRNLNLSYDSSKYNSCGSMNRGSNKYPIFSWQYNTNYDSRDMSWRENLYTDYEYLYEFYTDMLKKEPSQIEKYQRIRDKGYLTADDKVNLICIKDTNAKWIEQAEFVKSLPEAGEDIWALLNELGDKTYKLKEPTFPEHIRPLAKLYCKPMLVMHIIELLVNRGTLSLPNKEASYGLNTLLFCDKLPE